jgi:hypothetical protein
VKCYKNTLPQRNYRITLRASPEYRSAGIATRLKAEQPKNLVSILGRDMTYYLSSQQHRVEFEAHLASCPLHTEGGGGVPFPGYSDLAVTLINHVQLMPILRMHVAIPRFLHTSWRRGIYLSSLSLSNVNPYSASLGFFFFWKPVNFTTSKLLTRVKLTFRHSQQNKQLHISVLQCFIAKLFNKPLIITPTKTTRFEQ